MLIVKNGHGELVAKSATSAPELGSTAAFASMGVFHGLVAVKGRQAVPAAAGGGGAAVPPVVLLDQRRQRYLRRSVVVPPLHEACTSSCLTVPTHGSPKVPLSALIEQKLLPTQ